MAKDTVKRTAAFVEILRDVGVPVTAETKIMDLGCGAGRMVQAGRAQGLQFFGAGYQLYDAHEPAPPELVEQGVLRQITDHPYRLPFDDGFFDIVISDQVFEHVMDYPGTLAEVQRVLRPGGAFLHIFPSRYTVIEPHVRVPLAAFLRARWWMRLWAELGVRNEFQRKLTAREATADSLRYLSTRTNYYGRRRLRREFARYFSDVSFVEGSFLKTSERGSKVHRLSKWLPFLPMLYSAIGSRVVFGRRPLPAAAIARSVQSGVKAQDARLATLASRS